MKKRWYEYRKMKKRHEVLLEELKAIAPEESMLAEICNVLTARIVCKSYYSTSMHFIEETWNDFKKGKE